MYLSSVSITALFGGAIAYLGTSGDKIQIYRDNVCRCYAASRYTQESIDKTVNSFLPIESHEMNQKDVDCSNEVGCGCDENVVPPDSILGAIAVSARKKDIRIELFVGAYETVTGETSSFITQAFFHGCLHFCSEPMEWALKSLLFDLGYNLWNPVLHRTISAGDDNESGAQSNRRLNGDIEEYGNKSRNIAFEIDSYYHGKMTNNTAESLSCISRRNSTRVRDVARIVLRYIVLPILVHATAHTVSSTTLHVLAEELPSWMTEILENN